MPRQKQQRQGKNYLKRRAAQQQRVVEPLTPKGVRRETRAATNLRYRPVERAIQGEMRASERRVKEQGDWWQNYLDTVNQGRTETQAAYGAAGAASQAQVGQASAIDSANTQRLQGEAAKSAELRGVAPSTAPAEREAASQAQRNYLAAAQGGALAKAGANQFAYLTDQKRIGVGQSIAARKEEQRRGRSIRQDLRNVRSDRGEYAATKRGELRQGERDYLIQRQAFNLDKAGAAMDAREAARDRQLDREQFGETQRHNRATERNAAADNASGPGGMTPSERRDARRGRKSANVTARSLYAAAKKKPSTPAEWNAFIILVAKEAEGADQVDAKRAVNKLRKQIQGAGLYDPDVAGHSAGR